MKILFDANVPVQLAHFLRGHQVTRADEIGWQELMNGALLDMAERKGFNILITCDKNIQYQHNFMGRRLAIVILPFNRWPRLKPIAARLAARLDFVQAGQIVLIDMNEL